MGDDKAFLSDKRNSDKRACALVVLLLASIILLFSPSSSCSNPFEMPAVYKSLLKANGDKPESEKEVKKNKQRVLILSSRGVTYRYV